MLIKGENRMSTLRSCIDAATDFLLTEETAIGIIENQIATIADQWHTICTQAKLTETDKKLFAGRQFLNAYCIEGLHGHKALQTTFLDARDALVASGDS